jgi:thioredoxin reductase (NADPH)
MENVIIIGSGCAGWTAALYTARADLKPLLVTGQMPGGLLTTTTLVENFPGFPEGVQGFDLMVNMQQQAERFGTRTQFGSTVQAVDLSSRPFKVTIDGKVHETQTLIIATGAGHRHLGLPSEKALDTKGVTYCATCDGALPMFRDKPLVVVGGGDSACEEALYLTRFASKVHLIHRRDSLRASKIMADRVLAHEKIEKHWDTTVEQILGEDVGHVTGVRLKNLISGQESQMDCAGVFIAVGLQPNTALFAGQITTDDTGYIVPTHGSHTNVEGVFVAGDCADKHYRQAITAAAMGCMAAIDAERFLMAQA